MTRIWDEKFEATGYDETWSVGETVGTGNTLDEDADPSDVSSPSGWGSECLKMIHGGVNEHAYVRDSSFGDEADTYWRFEFVLSSNGMANGENNLILYVLDSAWAPVFRIYLQHDSGSPRLKFTAYHDGTQNDFWSSSISTGTRYRIEVQWDATANEWEWQIDGVEQDSGALTATHPTGITHVFFGSSYSTGGPITVYYDLFAVDDTTWVGAEVVGGISVPVAWHHLNKHC